MARTIRIKKSKQLEMPDKETLKMLVEFLTFASKKLDLGQEPVVVTLLHAAPEKPITTGAFSPDTKEIDCIVENRHFIDYSRTIAHEMVHLKQSTEGRTEGKIQEIGGEIEDEANAFAGQIMKEYIKTILTAEQRKHLGLGNYS